ncbi:MAG: S24/S26 family peptidase [Acidobacteriota bacterium]
MTGKLSRAAAGRNGASRTPVATFEMLAEGLADASTVSCRLTGDSMRPLLCDGDQMILEALHTPASVGSLLLFQSEHGELVCHRVIQAGPPIALLGDANRRLDLIPPGRPLGRAVAAVRGGRRLRLDGGAAAGVAAPLAWAHRHSRRWRTGSSRALRVAGRVLDIARVGVAHAAARIAWSRATPERR